MWFICKIKTEKENEHGMLKMETEQHLVDAISYADAEERITQEMKCYYETFSIVSVVRRNYNEMFLSGEGDRYFEAIIDLLVVDMEKGTEKVVKSKIIVFSTSIKDALNEIEKGMKGTMCDWHLSAIKETMILEAYKKSDDTAGSN